MGWVVHLTYRTFYPRERDPISIVLEDGWAPGPVWTGMKNLAPPGFDPHTVQPVARSYTDYAVPALEEHKGGKITNWILSGLNL